jgi:hypothetical protein
MMPALRVLSIFASGMLVHELLVHVWFILDDMLPFTSEAFFNFTLTARGNLVAMSVDGLLLAFFFYLGWVQRWGPASK